MNFEVLNPLPNSLDKLEKKVEKLYFLGDKTLLEKPRVAIVGSRRPNVYTKRVVNLLSSSLSSRGVCVVSGLAMGVDALAHMGAYPNTIGVLANSLDLIYPKVNQDLFLKMQKNSLLLSEYEVSTKATPWSFVDRNRIVVALSSAVVIGQADLKSGSMHSAKIAQKLKKPLFVLPQRMFESEGTNELLAKNQAKLINDIEAFCDMFGEKKEKKRDEILEFCKQNPFLEEALEKYKDKIYEYELDGKISIDGIYIRVNS